MSNDGTLNQRESGSGVLDAPLQSKEPAGWAGRNLQSASDSEQGQTFITTDRSVNIEEGAQAQINHGNVGTQDNRAMFAEIETAPSHSSIGGLGQLSQELENADYAVEAEKAAKTEADAQAQQESSIAVGPSIESQINGEEREPEAE